MCSSFKQTNARNLIQRIYCVNIRSVYSTWEVQRSHNKKKYCPHLWRELMEACSITEENILHILKSRYLWNCFYVFLAVLVQLKFFLLHIQKWHWNIFGFPCQLTSAGALVPYNLFNKNWSETFVTTVKLSHSWIIQVLGLCFSVLQWTPQVL